MEHMSYLEFRKLNQDTKKSKYNNVPTTYNGKRYQSKLEADYAAQLDMMKRAGEVNYWLGQVPFALEGGVIYKADFLILFADGHYEVWDSKGKRTAEFIIKKKQMWSMHHIEVKEVK
jgi:hypothetical protein